MIKFIEDLNQSKKGKMKEDNLLNFLKFYDIVKTDMIEIEKLISQNNNSWFINPKIF